MGSLMAGLNSHVRDPRTVKLERNKSLTKEGIEAYWRSRKKAEEEQETANISEVEMKRCQVLASYNQLFRNVCGMATKDGGGMGKEKPAITVGNSTW
ncbi:hypothetical protein RHMOL_Rhmol07G0306500 [Rhododendron molle]|uniref:Uncharacterized protein n=1 Tax=Rhododendron molle TaxID=49168 RepID=A0ACC0N7K7_RHOML|nr:hypothetical protein RHMOL_Rhmol07G0306500 [Rhododendron molle]